MAVIGIGVSNTPLLRLLGRASPSPPATAAAGRRALWRRSWSAPGPCCGWATASSGPGPGRDFPHPGLRPDAPELEAARARGSVITSEMEVFFQVAPAPSSPSPAPDGKTTTTTIIAELLRAAGHTVHVGGNIGHPLLAGGRYHPAGWARAGQLPADDHDPQPSHRRGDQSGPQPGCAQEHGGVCLGPKENIFRHQPGTSPSSTWTTHHHPAAGPARPGRALYFSRQAEPENGVFLRGDAVISRRDGHEHES